MSLTDEQHERVRRMMRERAIQAIMNETGLDRETATEEHDAFIANFRERLKESERGKVEE